MNNCSSKKIIARIAVYLPRFSLSHMGRTMTERMTFPILHDVNGKYCWSLTLVNNMPSYAKLRFLLLRVPILSPRACRPLSNPTQLYSPLLHATTPRSFLPAHQFSITTTTLDSYPPILHRPHYPSISKLLRNSYPPFFSPRQDPLSAGQVSTRPALFFRPRKSGFAWQRAIQAAQFIRPFRHSRRLGRAWNPLGWLGSCLAGTTGNGQRTSGVGKGRLACRVLVANWREGVKSLGRADVPRGLGNWVCEATDEICTNSILRNA